MRHRAALLAMILLVAACAGPVDRPAAGGPETSLPPATSSAPFGTVDLVGGGQIDGAELAGRDVALWFWAPW